LVGAGGGELNRGSLGGFPKGSDQERETSNFGRGPNSVFRSLGKKRGVGVGIGNQKMGRGDGERRRRTSNQARGVARAKQSKIPKEKRGGNKMWGA